VAYPIFDIDITKPLPDIFVSNEDTGVAVLLRKQGRPIDFLIEELPSNRELKLQQVTQRIGEIARENLSEEGRNADQGPPLEHCQFPSLTIAICTRDRPHCLARCLEVLKKMMIHTHSTGSSIEIIVIDNAPSDNRTLEVVSSFSDVRYVCLAMPGLSVARNRALKEANGQLLAYLDDDDVVDLIWLSGLVKAWSENPTAAAYTGLVLPYELVSEAQVMFEQRGGFRRGFKKVSYGQTSPGYSLYPLIPWICGVGANMAFQTDILRKLGGFDEALGAGTLTGGGDDLDIFYRLIRAGYSLQYEPNYLVFHQHRWEFQALRDQFLSWGLSYMAFVAKSYYTDPAYRGKMMRLVIWWIAKKLWQFPKSIFGRHALPPSMIFAELWGGIQGLFGSYSRSKRQVEKIRAQLVPPTGKKS